MNLKISAERWIGSNMALQVSHPRLRGRKAPVNGYCVTLASGLGTKINARPEHYGLEAGLVSNTHRYKKP